MIPNKGGDTQSQPREDKSHQQEMGGMFSVILTCNQIDVDGNVGHSKQTVDTKSDKVEQDKFDQTAIGV
jgi:hypothetical protein